MPQRRARVSVPEPKYFFFFFSFFLSFPFASVLFFFPHTFLNFSLLGSCWETGSTRLLRGPHEGSNTLKCWSRADRPNRLRSGLSRDEWRSPALFLSALFDAATARGLPNFGWIETWARFLQLAQHTPSLSESCPASVQRPRPVRFEGRSSESSRVGLLSRASSRVVPSSRSRLFRLSVSALSNFGIPNSFENTNPCFKRRQYETPLLPCGLKAGVKMSEWGLWVWKSHKATGKRVAQECL